MSFDNYKIKLLFDNKLSLYITNKEIQLFPYLKTAISDLLSFNKESQEIVFSIPCSKKNFIKAIDILEKREHDYDLSFIKLFDFLNVTGIKVPYNCKMTKENYELLINYDKLAAYNMFKYNIINKLCDDKVDYIIDDHITKLYGEY